jgi:hypothetical protein
MANVTAKLMWVQALLQELHISSPGSTRLWCDNMGTKYLSLNHVFHGHMKHIEVDYQHEALSPHTTSSLTDSQRRCPS